MDVCEKCISYDSEDCYAGTGFCKIWDDYVTADEPCCEEYREVGDDD